MEVFNLIGSISSIIGLLIAIFLAKEIISIRNTIKVNSKTETTQKKNRVKGDQAGRDINK